MTRDRSICGRYFAFVVAFAAAVGMKKKKKIPPAVYTACAASIHFIHKE